MLTPEKAAIIRKAYYSEGGYGSMTKTLKDAKQMEGGKSIRIEDVRAWFNKNLSQKTKITRYNSYVAQGPKEEYQADLMFFKDINQQPAVLMIDIFTKRVAVDAVDDKKLGSVLAGIMTTIQQLGGYPKVLYTDEEPAITSPDVVKFLEEKGTRLITTRNHAAFAERAIRTIKNMLYRRIEASDKEDPQWKDFIAQVLVTYNYKDVHSSIKMTPAEASKPANHMEAKINMEMRAKHRRRYPDLEVGDKVRIYQKKKDGFEKERVPRWSPEICKVVAIEPFQGQDYYKLEDSDGDSVQRLYARFELLRVTDD